MSNLVRHGARIVGAARNNDIELELIEGEVMVWVPAVHMPTRAALMERLAADGPAIKAFLEWERDNAGEAPPCRNWN